MENFNDLINDLPDINEQILRNNSEKTKIIKSQVLELIGYMTDILKNDSDDIRWDTIAEYGKRIEEYGQSAIYYLQNNDVNSTIKKN